MACCLPTGARAASPGSRRGLGSAPLVRKAPWSAPPAPILRTQRWAPGERRTNVGRRQEPDRSEPAKRAWATSGRSERRARTRRRPESQRPLPRSFRYTQGGFLGSGFDAADERANCAPRARTCWLEERAGLGRKRWCRARPSAPFATEESTFRCAAWETSPPRVESRSSRCSCTRCSNGPNGSTIPSLVADGTGRAWLAHRYLYVRRHP